MASEEGREGASYATRVLELEKMSAFGQVEVFDLPDPVAKKLATLDPEHAAADANDI